MKIYIRAYWFDDDNESIDDFIYGRTPSNRSENFYDEDNAEFVSENSFEDDLGYSDFDEYELYDYSEYEDFYKQVKRRQVYVPVHVARDIPDYNDYRKSLFGTLYLSMKSGESIETLYDELSTGFPGIVKRDIMSAPDMLIEIVDATLYAQNLLNAA